MLDTTKYTADEQYAAVTLLWKGSNSYRNSPDDYDKYIEWSQDILLSGVGTNLRQMLELRCELTRAEKLIGTMKLEFGSIAPESDVESN